MGVAAELSSESGKVVEVDANNLMKGSLYKTVIKSQTRKLLSTIELQLLLLK